MAKTVLYVMLDDLGSAMLTDALPYLTHIPALAADGITFTQAIVPSPLCCPARASFMTGQFPSKHGVLDNEWPVGGAAKMADDETLPVWLQAAGWKTAYIGKYLNDFLNNGHFPSWPYVPPGWDTFRVFVDPLAYKNYIMHEDGVMQAYGSTEAEYSTNVLRDHAVDVLTSADPDDDLCVIVAFNAPHTPSTVNAADAAVFNSIAQHRPPSFNVPRSTPHWVSLLGPISTTEQANLDTKRKKAISTLLAVDRAVGTFKDTLVSTGRWDDAIVVLVSSDNGYHYGEHRIDPGKKTAYEECITVPLIVRTPTSSGTTDGRLVSMLDLTATILDYAGATATIPQDGISLKPVLDGDLVTPQEAVFIEWMGSGRPKFTAVREPGFILVDYVSAQQGMELYDLTNDPYQLTNHIDNPAYAADKARLLARLSAR